MTDEHARTEHRPLPFVGSGPWYAKATRVMGWLLVFSQVIAIADYIAPTAHTPTLGYATALTLLVGGALIFAAGTWGQQDG